MTERYCYLHLHAQTSASGSREQPQESAADLAYRACRDAQAAVWGVWDGVFGVASNECVAIIAGAEIPGGVRESHLEMLDSMVLEATVRPTTGTPLTRAGLYVFRTFDVRPADVDHFVELSARAWETFEGAASYAAEPQGLFRTGASTASAGARRLLLVTWYDSFASWEVSRRPAAEAAENFQQRRTLTLATRAIAGRLREAPEG